MTRVVVIGGGYAGIACLAELRVHLPAAELHLIDPAPWHLKLTRLHEAASRPLDELRVPFAHVVERLNAVHHAAAAGETGRFDTADIAAWSAAGAVPVLPTDGSGMFELPFDYLIVATGASPAVSAPMVEEAPADDPPRLFALDALRTLELRETLRELAAGRDPGDDFRVSVVGAGASGIQYAFELAEAVRRLGFPAAVRVLDVDRHVLPEMPSRVHRYVLERMRLAGIEWLPGCRFLRQAGDVLHYQVEARTENVRRSRSSPCCWRGSSAYPEALIATNRFGQTPGGGALRWQNVLAAGDCAVYWTRPVRMRPRRRSRCARASTCRGQRQPDSPTAPGSAGPGCSRELGYVVSLGAVDAVGWVFTAGPSVLTGMACGRVSRVWWMRSTTLYLEGIDTYRGVIGRRLSQ
jgi:NADH dehydrogenase